MNKILSGLLIGLLYGCGSSNTTINPIANDTGSINIDSSINSEGIKVHRSAHFPTPNLNDAGVLSDSEADIINDDTGFVYSGIGYHGGPVMTGNVNIYIVWYGNYHNATGPVQDIVTDFIINLSGSPWYQINTTYYEELPSPLPDAGTSDSKVSTYKDYVANSFTLVKTTIDNYSHGNSLVLNDVEGIVVNSISNGSLPFDSNGVYFVLTSSDVQQFIGWDNFCYSFCGWHNHFNFGGADIKYAFVGNPELCPDACISSDNGSNSPNGNIGADGMVSLIAHELSEATSDPDLNAWYQDSFWGTGGYENADLCAWTFGTTYKVPLNGSSANVRLGDRDYLIQQNWVNSPEGGYCALSLKY